MQSSHGHSHQDKVKAEPSDISSIHGDGSLVDFGPNDDPMMLINAGRSDSESNPGSPTGDERDLFGLNFALDDADLDYVDVPFSDSQVYGNPYPYESEKMSPHGYGHSPLPSGVMSHHFGRAGFMSASSRRGRYKLWSDDQMSRAMKLVSQHHFSYVRAAQECGVPESSLRERLRKKIMRGELVYSPVRKRRALLPSEQMASAGGSQLAKSDQAGPSNSGASAGSSSPHKSNEALKYVFEGHVPAASVCQRFGLSLVTLKAQLRHYIVNHAMVPANPDTCLTVEQERQILKWFRKRMQASPETEVSLATFKDLVHSAVVVDSHLHSNLMRAFTTELLDEECFQAFIKRHQLKNNGNSSAVVSSSGEAKATVASVAAENGEMPPDMKLSSPQQLLLPMTSGNGTSATASSSSANQALSEAINFDEDEYSPSVVTEKDDVILVLQTGGTIDKVFSSKLPGGSAFQIGAPASAAILDRFCSRSVQTRYSTVCRKNGQDVSNADIAHLCTLVRESSAERVLITHGIDTMLDTAQILASASYQKVIVLTGARKPYALKESDAEFNLGLAIGALQSLAQYGVYVAIQGSVFKWNEVHFDKTTEEFIAKK